jgi:hypothetical protein
VVGVELAGAVVQGGGEGRSAAVLAARAAAPGASWLVQEGVPLYDVQAQLEHESFTVTQRYSHLQPDAHGAVEAARSRMIGNHATHEKRTEPPGAGSSAG